MTVITTRINVIGVDAEHEGLRTLSDMTVRQYVDINAIETARKYLLDKKAMKMVIEDLLVAHEEDLPLPRAIHISFTMVFEGYGMTIVEEMAYFTSIVTKALLIDIIREECMDFKQKLAAFKETHPEHWKLGRILNLDGINSLNHANFPQLYYCTVARVREGGKFAGYRSSNHDLKESPQTLANYARTALSGKLMMTLDVANQIKDLTGNNVDNLIGHEA